MNHFDGPRDFLCAYITVPAENGLVELVEIVNFILFLPVRVRSSERTAVHGHVHINKTFHIVTFQKTKNFETTPKVATVRFNPADRAWPLEIAKHI